MIGLLVRLVALALVGIARLVLVGLVLAVRLLLAVLGLRGARLAWMVATCAAVAWAAPHVGLRLAVALAALGWLAWTLRRAGAQRGARRALRRPGTSRADRVVLRRLAAGLEAHTRALRSSAAHHTHRPAHALTGAPALAPEQSPAQAWRALERHAAAWTHHHTQPASAWDGEGR